MLCSINNAVPPHRTSGAPLQPSLDGQQMIDGFLMHLCNVLSDDITALLPVLINNNSNLQAFQLTGSCQVPTRCA